MDRQAGAKGELKEFMNKNKIFLSVIIPAYNEAVNFKKEVLEQVDAYMQKQHYEWEVIVVDDGSKDETAGLVKGFIRNKKKWQLICNSHQGKAATVTKGILSAKGENILFTDFDQATPINQVEKLLEKVKQEYQIVIGSREIKGAKREKEPFYRHLMGKGFNLMVKIFVIGGIEDTQCGFKLFTNPAVRKIFPKVQVYKAHKIADAYTGAFDVELLFLAKKFNLRTAEVPVIWHHVKTERVNPIKDSLRMFIDIIKIRIYNILGKYEN